MYKKRKIDFILNENNPEERLIFRFYPRQSSCHSFGENPPKTWDEVYKIYYSYAVIQQWRDTPETPWESERIFCEHCDECSIIDAIGRRCLLLADGAETYNHKEKEYPLLNDPIFPFGMGTEWTITKKESIDWTDETKKNIFYCFTLFDWFNKGCRFTIPEAKIKAFGAYLLECCEYMLAHGNPI